MAHPAPGRRRPPTPTAMPAAPPSARSDAELPADLQAPLAVASWHVGLDRDGRIATWGSEAARCTGRTARDVIGQPWTDLWPDEAMGRSIREALLDAARLGHARRRGIAVRADGRKVAEHVTVHAQLDGDEAVVGYLVVVAPTNDGPDEATARHALEAALRRAEEQFRVALLNAPMVLSGVGPDLRFLWHYGPYARLAEDQVVGRRMDELREAVNGDDVVRAQAQVLRDGQPRRVLVQMRFGNEERHFDMSIHPTRDPSGRVVGIVQASLDITERLRTEEALRVSERLFRQAFDESGVGMGLVGLDGRWLRVNPALTRMLGHSEAELLAATLEQVTAPEDRRAVGEAARRLLAGEQAVAHGRRRYLRKDGRTVVAQIARTLVRDGQGTPLYFIHQIQDITEQVALEDRLRDAQKLDALGRLTGGIAHDFNNMLTTIRGNAELLAQDLDPIGLGHTELDAIVLAAQRASELTSRLLAFGRRSMLRPRRVEVSPLVEEALLLAGRPQAGGPRVVLSLRPDAGAVDVDPTVLQQAVVNMLLNAREATTPTDAVEVSTAHLQIAPQQASLYQVAPGEYVRITVRDTGRGMDEPMRARVFEPYFTSHQTTGGTGLGLAMVYGFVKQSHGHIEVESTPGKGSSFHLYLPRSRQPAPDRPQPPQVQARTGHATGAVLVVDDEPAVRQIVQRCLQAAGHRVIVAESGGAALELLDVPGLAVDVVLCDVRMPDLSGPAVVAEVARRRPGLPVGLMSGFLDDAEALGATGTAPLLHKPFSTPALLAFVQQLLGLRSTAQA